MKNNKKKSRTIIVAPHPDDEIIGCYSYLINNRCDIIYTSSIDSYRKKETENLSIHLGKEYIGDQIYNSEIPDELIQMENLYLFPDPINEIHPDHRRQGHIGEEFIRDGFDVIFYSTIMNVAWVNLQKQFENKKLLLNKCYPSQKSLWKYEHKYFLFEGYYKWIMK